MHIKYLVKQGQYHDSVSLMEAARELLRLPGVSDAAVVMASQANQSILQQAHLFLPAMASATPNDLLIVVQADSQAAADSALEAAEKILARRPAAAASGSAFRPRTVRAAARAAPAANLAVISVAGQHAVAEAWEALRSGLHVLLFSDNVPLEAELALKQYALQHDLLMMGADCGTAIINGIALGFANAVPRGPVGIVAAAGTGLQEASTLLAKLGVGVSQGLGTGGRDMKDAIGGLAMLQGVKALQADPASQVLLLISKLPTASVAQRVLEQVRQAGKPAVVCFLGGRPEPSAAAGAIAARTLQEAAYLAAAEVEGYQGPPARQVLEREASDLQAQALELRRRLVPGQLYLRGLFSGGTLAAEALVVWEGLLEGVLSNVAAAPDLKLEDATRSRGNCIVDLGEDEFTVGRPHPMIDHDLRIRRLMQEAADAQVAVVLLDVVLGYGAHPDPAAELGPAIARARQLAAGQGRELIVVASVTGTQGDPQGLDRQATALRDYGAQVASCNAAAARLAGWIVRGTA